MKKEKRFIRTYTDDGGTVTNEIWVDKETGVNYYYHTQAMTGGLSPVYDKEGNILITPLDELDI